MHLCLTAVADTQNLGWFYFGVDPLFFTCRGTICESVDFEQEMSEQRPVQISLLSRVLSVTLEFDTIVRFRRLSRLSGDW